ncbi:hypothetical protein K501DRAFT_237754 [Backusella circina FSU 941]|nr:hypothetical protein K501DRAFT_237754 [Backusella circina FSU 941]
MFSPILKKSLTTAAVGAVWLSSATTALAEKRTKLSIYDDPEPEVVIIESPTKLEEHVHIAQTYANERFEEGKTHVDSYKQKYQELETQVTDHIKKTIDKDEQLFPNLAYVGVAALAGTIIARRRNIILRLLTSTALGVTASYYFLPKTTHNVALELERLERKSPQLVEAHQKINMHLESARQKFGTSVAQARSVVDENATKLRDTVDVSKLRQSVDENANKLREQLGQTAEKVKEEASDAEKKSEEKFEEVKKSVESMYSTRSKPGVDETLRKSS